MQYYKLNDKKNIQNIIKGYDNCKSVKWVVLKKKEESK